VDLTVSMPQDENWGRSYSMSSLSHHSLQVWFLKKASIPCHDKTETQSRRVRA
jgi:hypothetical protein